MNEAIRIGAIPVSPLEQLRALGAFDGRTPFVLAARKLQRSDDPILRAAAHRAESDHYLMVGAVTRARDAIRDTDPARSRVIDLIANGPPADLRPLLNQGNAVDGALMRVLAAWADPRAADALDLLDDGMARARDLGPGIAARLGLIAAQVHHTRDELEHALLQALRTLLYAREAGEGRLVRVAGHLVTQLQDAGDDRIERLIQATLSVTSATGSAVLPQLARATLALVHDAQRAFVLVGDHGDLQVRGAAYAPGFDGAPSLSIARSCVVQGAEVVTQQAQAVAASQSISDMQLRTVVCLPLTDGTRTFGALYADSTTATDQQLQNVVGVLRAFCAHAAVVLANDRLLAEARHHAMQARQLAHDLRNVAGGMGLALGVLREEVGRDTPTMQTMVRMNEVLTASLQHLLDGHGPVDAPVHMDVLVRDTLDLLRFQAEARGVDLLCRTEHLVVRGDADQLRRVVANLVGNAIKYTPEGGPVQVEVALREGAATLTVADRGPGIPAGAVRTIFDAGVQGANAAPGHGLGLAICKQIVEAHGGRITARNRSARGASFTVHLPLAR